MDSALSPHLWQLHPDQQPAQILTLIQFNGAAINLCNIADNGEAEPGARLARVQPCAAIKDAGAFFLGDSHAIVLDPHFAPARRGAVADGYKDAAAAIFRGVFDKIAQNFVVFDDV